MFGGLRIGYALLLPLAVLAMGSAQAATVLFEEDFNGNALDTQWGSQLGTWNSNSTVVNANSKWVLANWTDAGFKDVVWQRGHATLSGGKLNINLNKAGDGNAPCPNGCSDKRYASAQLITRERFGNNTRVEVRMKTAEGQQGGGGLISSTFRYLDSPHDEMDIEFLWKSDGKIHVGYFADGQSRHENIDLGFNASEGFHTYAFETVGPMLRWYVDGQNVQEMTAPKTLETGHVRLDLWTPKAGTGVANWAGTFTGDHTTAQYDWIKISAVPLPSAIWLFGGVLGMWAAGRRVLSGGLRPVTQAG